MPRTPGARASTFTVAVVLALSLGPDRGHALGAGDTLTPTEPQLKVAFIGDSGSGSSFRRVLKLIKAQGAKLVLHQGDLAYLGLSTGRFFRAIDDVLGPRFPYFASRGNHDIHWRLGYQPELERRAREAGAVCTGDYGQNSACTYRGLFFILSAGGESGSVAGNTRYIRARLAADRSLWRVCSWHRNQRTLQVGLKGDEVGWGPYEACRAEGAIIATGHGHYYARTRSLESIKSLAIHGACNNPEGDRLCVARENAAAGAPGVTFAFVSGLGGMEHRAQRRCLPTRFPYGQGRGCNDIWARIYSSKQGASHGALFITFYAAGDPYQAVGEFVNVHGKVIDSFTVRQLRTTPPL